jgi:hypothetical protein
MVYIPNNGKMLYKFRFMWKNAVRRNAACRADEMLTYSDGAGILSTACAQATNWQRDPTPLLQERGRG